METLPKHNRVVALWSTLSMNEYLSATIIILAFCTSPFFMYTCSIFSHKCQIGFLFCQQGVKFMYDCVTGVQIPNNNGCIMADEMVGTVKRLN